MLLSMKAKSKTGKLREKSQTFFFYIIKEEIINEGNAVRRFM